MGKYVLKRVLLLIPIMLAVIFIVYFLMDLAPGDPASIILGEAATEDAIIELNTSLGYYDPFIVSCLEKILILGLLLAKLC